MGNFKMVPAALRPFGRTVIFADLAKKLKETTADEEFTKLKGQLFINKPAAICD